MDKSATVARLPEAGTSPDKRQFDGLLWIPGPRAPYKTNGIVGIKQIANLPSRSDASLAPLERQMELSIS